MARSARKLKKNPARLSAQDRRLVTTLELLAKLGGFRPTAEEVGDDQVRFVLVDPVSKKRLCIDDVPPLKEQTDVQRVRDEVCEALRMSRPIRAGMSSVNASYYGSPGSTSYLQLVEGKGFDSATRKNLIDSLKEAVNVRLESIALNKPLDAKRWQDARAFSESLLTGRPYKELRAKPLMAPKKEKITDLRVFSRYGSELKQFSALQTQMNLVEASVDKVQDRARQANRPLTAAERGQLSMFEDTLRRLRAEENDLLSARSSLGRLLKNWREYAGKLGSTTLPVGEYRGDIVRDGRRWRFAMQLYIISGYVRPEDVKRELNDSKRQLASLEQLVERETRKAKALGVDPEKASADERSKVAELQKQVATLSRQLDDVRGAKSPMRQTTFWMFWLPFITQDPIDYKKTFDFDGADKYLKDAPILVGRPMPSFKLDDVTKAKKYLEDLVDKQLSWYRRNGIKPVFKAKGKAEKREQELAELATSGHPSLRQPFTDPRDWAPIVRVIQERNYKKRLRDNKTLRGLESYGYKSKKRAKAKDIDVGDQIWHNNGWRTVYVVAGETDRSLKLERGKTEVILRIEYAGLDDSGKPSPRELRFDENASVLIRKPRLRPTSDPKSERYAQLLSQAQELALLRGLSPVYKGQSVQSVIDQMTTLRTGLQSDLDAGVASFQQRKLIRDQIQEIDEGIALMRGEKATREAISESAPKRRKGVKLADIKQRRVEVKPEPRKKYGYKSLKHRQELLEKAARESGKYSSVLKRLDDIDIMMSSAEVQLESEKQKFQDLNLSGASREKKAESLNKAKELKAELKELQDEKKKLLSSVRERPTQSIKQLKAAIKSEPEENPMRRRLTLRDPMFEMDTLPKTRRARKNIEKAYADELLTERQYQKLTKKADAAMEKFTDEALGLATNPKKKKNPRSRDVDAVLFEYKYKEINKAEARKRLKALGLKKSEIDGLLKYIGNPLKPNPTLAERRASRARARADIERARAEAERARAEAQSARSKRRVKKDSEALFPRIRQAYEKYIVGEEEREATEQELLSQATEIAENARDLLDQWRESAVNAKLRGTMPHYNKLVAALLEALLAREAFSRLDETTKANQMDVLRKRIQKEIVDIMEGKKTISQVQRSSSRLADVGESTAESVTAMGGMGGLTTGATVTNPGRATHDKNAHKFAARSVKKWEKYCSTGKCSDLVNAYADMVVARQEFEYIGDKKSAKQIEAGMKQARSQMGSLLKSSLKAA